MITHDKLHHYYESKIDGRYTSEELFTNMVSIVIDTDPSLNDDAAFDKVMQYLDHRIATKFAYDR